MKQQLNGQGPEALIVDDIIAYFKSDIIGDEAFTVEETEEILNQGLIDSMGIVRLLAHLQQRYDIPDWDRRALVLDNFRTVRAIANMVAQHTASHAPVLNQSSR